MIATVVFDKDSIIGEFDYGQFSGWVTRVEARPARWNGSEMLPADPAHWVVNIEGIEKAWCCVRLKLKRGRTRIRVIEEACSIFESPADIKPDNGQFGYHIDYPGEET